METVEELYPVEKERRACQRFHVKEGALAFFEAVPGEIIDISMSGMSLKYVPLDNVDSQQVEIDIFVPGQDFYLPGLSCRLVSQVDYPKSTPYQSIQVKQMRVQFCDLTPDQCSGLKSFIQHNMEPVYNQFPGGSLSGSRRS